MKVVLLNYTKDPDQICAAAAQSCYSEKGASELFRTTTDPRQVAEALYLGCLGRLPTEDEWDLVQGYCGSSFGGQNIAWALINSEEFLYRH